VSITAARLRELLHYDPSTGIFRWRVARGGCVAGEQAGTLHNDGYLWITVDYEQYAAHRLAWLYMTGTLPAEQIDHRDQRRANNSWDNLREATHAQNQHNVSMREDNSSGFKGVSYHRQAGKWLAQIRCNGAKIYLGIHPTPEAAAVAYAKAANDLHGEFASTAGSSR
jgi:hypothetical protein